MRPRLWNAVSSQHRAAALQAVVWRTPAWHLKIAAEHQSAPAAVGALEAWCQAGHDIAAQVQVDDDGRGWLGQRAVEQVVAVDCDALRVPSPPRAEAAGPDKQWVVLNPDGTSKPQDVRGQEQVAAVAYATRHSEQQQREGERERADRRSERA